MDIKNTNEVGCMICNNPNISKIVDEYLIEASMTADMLVEHLAEVNGIHLTKKDIENHKKHLFTILECDANNELFIKENYEKIKDAKNIEVINQEIAKLEFILKNMTDKRQEHTVAFNNISKIKLKYIELKMKIEGEDTLVVEHKIPEWIKMVK